MYHNHNKLNYNVRRVILNVNYMNKNKLSKECKNIINYKEFKKMLIEN